MKFLVCEDDYITSQVMYELMLAFGDCDIAEDGKVSVELFADSLKNNNPYSIVFLDIMMPELDGQGVLAMIRKLEAEHNIFGLDCSKVIMTSALDDYQNIKNAFGSQCDGYLVKPIEKDMIVGILNQFGMIAF